MLEARREGAETARRDLTLEVDEIARKRDAF